MCALWFNVTQKIKDLVTKTLNTVSNDGIKERQQTCMETFGAAQRLNITSASNFCRRKTEYAAAKTIVYSSFVPSNFC